jgi:hypothetical protein
MTFRAKIVILTIGIGLAVLGGVLLYTPPSETESLNSSIRKFKLKLVENNRFRYGGSTIQAWQEVDGKLVILDQSSQQWSVLNQEGDVIRTIGEHGSAPWQNQEIKNFRILGDTLFSVDTRAMMVRKHKLGASQPAYKKLQEVIWDGVYLAGGKFLLLNDESTDFGFFTYDMKTGTTSAIQTLADFLGYRDKENQNIVFEGEFVQGSHYSYYICSRKGAFVVFDINGSIIHVKSTIDDSPAPKIVEKEAGNLVIFEREPDEIVNYSATADNEKLFILSQVAFQQTENLRLDIYSRTGEYMYSAEMPNRGDNYPLKILKGQTNLYVIYEDQMIVKYDLQKS